MRRGLLDRKDFQTISRLYAFIGPRPSIYEQTLQVFEFGWNWKCSTIPRSILSRKGLMVCQDFMQEWHDFVQQSICFKLFLESLFLKHGPFYAYARNKTNHEDHPKLSPAV